MSLQELGYDCRGQIYMKTILLVMLLMQQLILNEENEVRFMKIFCSGGLCFYL